MYVRLAFAVAAHLDPEILVVDEVLAVGDAEFQKKCLGKMEEVATGGRTVLFVSHNMGAVRALCGRALLLQGGTLTVTGPTLEVCEQYLRNALGSPTSTPVAFDAVVAVADFRLVADDCTPSTIFEIGEPIGISCTFSVLTPGFNPQPSFLITSDEGLKLFHAINTRDFRKPQTYHSIGWLRPNILNEGRYLLTFAVTTHAPVQIHTQIEAAFEVVASSSHQRRGHYRGKLHGLVQLPIEWLDAV
jgi:lipopolysaccharide transport system ATP-binding protein